MLTIKDLADRWNYDVKYLQNHWRNKCPPPDRPGGRPAWREETIEAFEQEKKKAA